MQAGYFATAWNDIKSSPGWMKKMFFLALINLIPIFGQIVTAGYLYGWARDIAWGVNGPMPARVFGNEDGKLYSRGFFILVLGLVLAIVPSIFYLLYFTLSGVGMFFMSGGGQFDGSSAVGAGMVGVLFYLLYLATIFAVSFFEMVGSMRISIYGRLSAGFQFKKIWLMIKKDFGGLLRIFGMIILMGLVLGIILSVLYFIFAFIVIFLMIGAGAGVSSMAGSWDNALVGMGFALIAAVVVLALIVSYITLVFGMFIQSMMVRALGYWTRQFDVPNWRGQDDPLPFEINPAAPYAQYSAPQQPYQGNAYQAPPVSGQAPYPQQGQQPFTPQPGQQPAQSEHPGQYQPTPQAQAGSAQVPAPQVPVQTSQPSSSDVPSAAPATQDGVGSSGEQDNS